MSLLSETTAEIKEAIEAERKQVMSAIAALEAKIDGLEAAQVSDEDLAELKSLAGAVGKIYEVEPAFSPE